MVLENLCGGATRPGKKFDDIFICFNTIPTVTDGHAAVAKTALAERRAGKNYRQEKPLTTVEQNVLTRSHP